MIIFYWVSLACEFYLYTKDLTIVNLTSIIILFRVFLREGGRDDGRGRGQKEAGNGEGRG